MKTRAAWIALFASDLDYDAYNIGHLVLDDGNDSDASIRFAIQYLDEHRDEYKQTHPGVSDVEINYVRAFLNFLLSVPYDGDDE